MLSAAFTLLLRLGADPGLVIATAPAAAAAPMDSAVEILPRPARGSLEEGLSGEIAQRYGAAVKAIISSQHRRALSETKQARALAYRALQGGPTPPRLARRHFTRILFLEEQLSELTVIEEQIEHPRDSALDRGILPQLRALLLQNLFLAVRGFYGPATGSSRGSGINDSRLLNQALEAYKLALDGPDTIIRQRLLVGFATLLAESGRSSEARRVFFTKLTDTERANENLDVDVAAFYVALGDRGRAIERLLEAGSRESWLRGNAGPVRTQVYRSNQFDRLRDHPRFIDLVTAPEES